MVSRPMLFLPLALFAVLLAVSRVAFDWTYRRLARPPSAQPPASSSGTQNSGIWSGFTDEVQDWASSILGWSKTYQLDPNLISLVMQLESCGNPRVRSPAGAMGLFQVMPFHFSSEDDPFDAETNARRGLSYLALALSHAGNQSDLALAGYNGGISIIHSDPATWEEETRRYVLWGQGILADITAGRSSSPTLEAWLDAGGAGLCRMASAVDRVTMSQ